jgi:hypothetical protein
MRATRQPRVTDAVELASTRAVSSIDRPPKNRSSTMRASPGSTSTSDPLQVLRSLFGAAHRAHGESP